MIVAKKNMKRGRIEIDLTGPQGNAFFLLGMAEKYAKQLGLDSEAILKEMQSSDYENLVAVFDKNFGQFVTLYK